MEAACAVHAADAMATIFRADTLEGNKELLQGLLGPLAQLSQVEITLLNHEPKEAPI